MKDGGEPGNVEPPENLTRRCGGAEEERKAMKGSAEPGTSAPGGCRNPPLRCHSIPRVHIVVNELKVLFKLIIRVTIR